MAIIRSAVVYEYDRQLRPGDIGVDFVDVNPDGSGNYTIRYDEDEHVKILADILKWIKRED
jgi:hypothetical protein